jgi:NADH-quinone oxidoreductase subunit I
MICARECPTWCISIDSHTEPVEDLPAGAHERTQNVLDRFAIDWSLCMYCGICVQECPFDALEWASEPTKSASTPDALVEEMVPRLAPQTDVTEESADTRGGLATDSW